MRTPSSTLHARLLIGVRVLCVALLLTTVAACDLLNPGGGDDPGDDRPDAQNVYDLPGEALFPEGIALAEDKTSFFVGSTNGGALLEVDIAGGTVDTFSEAGENGRAVAVGLETAFGGLWVAGGPTGQAFAYDAETGALLERFTTPPADDTFINDVAVTPKGFAYFTDSRRPILWRGRLTDGLSSELEPWLDLTGTPIAYQEGFNLNGIVAGPLGRYLITVQSNTGHIFRIDTVTKEVIAIRNGESFPNGDGLFLTGQTLYVVQNALNQIAPIELELGYAEGTPGEPITDDRPLRFPTTTTLYKGSLLTVNGQLATQDPTLPFTVARVELPDEEDRDE